MSEENTTTSEAVNFYAELSANNEKFTPTFEKSRGKKWVGWGHKGDNRYPEMLLELFKNSSLHGMIIKSKANMTIGQGFQTVENPETKKPYDMPQAQKEFLENCDGRGNSLKSIGDKNALDLQLFGGPSLLVTFDSTWTKIKHASYISRFKLRSFADLNEFGEITGHIYSEDWSKRQPYEPKYIPVLNVNEAIKIKEEYQKAFDSLDKEELTRIDNTSRTMIITSGYYLPDSVYYSVPFYGSATTVISTDISSDKFALDSLDAKLLADYIVQIDGITDVAEQNKAAKNFIARHTGAMKANKPPITFTKEGGKGGVTIIPTGLKGSDTKLTEINTKTQQKILSAHGVTSPTLVGIPPSGGLGNSSDLAKLSDLFQANIISHDQNKLTEMYNQIMRINEWPLLEIVPSINVFAEQEKTGEVVEEVTEENK